VGADSAAMLSAGVADCAIAGKAGSSKTARLRRAALSPGGSRFSGDCLSPRTR